MCIEQVRIGTTVFLSFIFYFFVLGSKEFQHVANDFVSVVAVMHTCPQIDFPTNGPACSFVAAINQCVASCLEKFRRAVWRNLIAWIKSVQMRHMTMLIFTIIPVVEPFLDLIIATDLHRSEAVDHLLKAIDILRVAIQYAGGIECVVQNIKSNLVVHRTSGSDASFLSLRCVLRRIR